MSQIIEKRLREDAYDKLITGRGEVFLWSVPDGAEARETAARIGLETARDEARKLTVYEARIPLAAVGLSEEAGRAGFRFNIDRKSVV